MKLSKVHIKNFRSIKDQEITLGAYNCFVGENGAGKSTVLSALNVFFGNTRDSNVDLLNLSEDDFHHRNTSEPVIITLTFEDISAEAACGKLALYIRQDQLIVSAVAEYDSGSGKAAVKQYGHRLVMSEFAKFFECDKNKGLVRELKDLYGQCKNDFAELPDVSKKDDMRNALREYEESHEDLCEVIDETNQFYGFTKGENLLKQWIEWVYVPAVKDAHSEQQEDGTKTALGRLLKRTVRADVNFEDAIEELKEDTREKYKEILEKQQSALEETKLSLENQLQFFSNPSIEMDLKWDYDPQKSIDVKEPFAKVRITEDEFVGDVTRLGHGIQRSFIFAVLVELADHHMEDEPTLVLGIEEPELYQHPPQAQYLAEVLQNMCENSDTKSQILMTTHSPYFVSAKGFEDMRRVHKSENSAVILSATYDQISADIAKALGKIPPSRTDLMARISQILFPSQRELFFSRIAIFVEGVEDVAFISTYLRLTGLWGEFRQYGCHFIITNGKNDMSRLIAIANSLDIPNFVIFDADVNNMSSSSEEKEKENNLCIYRLCNQAHIDPKPDSDQYEKNLIVWKDNIGTTVQSEIGEEDWDKHNAKVKENDFFNSLRAKNNMLIAAVVSSLYEAAIRPSSLQKAVESILDFAKEVNHKSV